MLDYEQIKEIINMIDESALRVFELEDKDIKLKLSKNTDLAVINKGDNMTRFAKEEIGDINPISYESVHKDEIENESNKIDEIEKKEENIKSVKSPLVGTYYSAATLNGNPYVTVGSKVKKGDTLCIIEAMKVMSEVTSEFDGVIQEVLKKDEDIVEYGMDLFKIKED